MDSVAAEFEGTLLKDPDPFPYFMLVAFEASGILRFAALMVFWPIIILLGLCGMEELGLRVMIFVATAGVRVSEIESVGRAVLPKFFREDVREAAWRVFRAHEKRVVVTRMPRVMVERFVKEYLGGDEVIGTELAVNRFGFATGLVRGGSGTVTERVARVFGGQSPSLGLGRAESRFSFLSICKEQLHQPNLPSDDARLDGEMPPNLPPVIFHDGRLVKRPNFITALMIVAWIPFGIVLAFIRIAVGLTLPLGLIPIIAPIFGGRVTVRGKRPPPVSSKNVNGVLFVCTHRTLMDPVVLSTVLGRKIPAVTYSISKLSEILSPIPTIRLTRVREVDKEKIQSQLSEGDLAVCPEGTTCREPFLLRFSALFAELTDRIVPVAMNYKVDFFHATTARGWKAMDPIFFFMNPRPIYEVTFLNQLPAEATCSSGKSPHDVANHVQGILAATLGFECTNFTRKDKYRVLAGNDGTVTTTAGCVSSLDCIKKVVGTFKPLSFHKK
ncbi:hypothetical protein MLD38_008736 [Melastoma candidum]|uniref:Uncharacterized protein n=1 Tax=Melastoma candidum TaxID=119954 RepID=A0ACB9RVG6_9MYRT|nr:hypothetical protein MLD38_008736 [Melastoma candidum]